MYPLVTLLAHNKALTMGIFPRMAFIIKSTEQINAIIDEMKIK